MGGTRHSHECITIEHTWFPITIFSWHHEPVVHIRTTIFMYTCKTMKKKQHFLFFSMGSDWNGVQRSTGERQEQPGSLDGASQRSSQALGEHTNSQRGLKHRTSALAPTPACISPSDEMLSDSPRVCLFIAFGKKKREISQEKSLFFSLFGSSVVPGWQAARWQMDFPVFLGGQQTDRW